MSSELLNQRIPRSSIFITAANLEASQQTAERVWIKCSSYWTLTYLRTPVYYQESFVPLTSVTSEMRDY